MFSIIACIGKNHEIGKKGKLIFNIKDDMKFFRETTTGHTIVMGYNTWRSLPSKLKNRTNLVISYDEVKDADQTIKNLDKYIQKNQNTNEEIFVIGGGMIYRTFLPYADALYLTEVDSSDTEADTFFPDFDKSHYHKTIIRKGSENGLDYSIVKYNKIRSTK